MESPNYASAKTERQNTQKPTEFSYFVFLTKLSWKVEHNLCWYLTKFW